MSDEERTAAEGSPAEAGGRRWRREAAAAPPRRARQPKTDGVLIRARPLLAAVAGVALGVACGQWLIGRLAGRLPPAQAQAAATVEAAALIGSAAPVKASSVAGVSQPPSPDEGAQPAGAEAGVKAPAAAEGASRRPPIIVGAERRRETEAAAARQTRREGATAGPVGRGAGAPSGRRGGRCELSVSAGAVSLRAGGSAVVTAAVDELAGRAAVTASTNHWPDIAVFTDSAGGRARYTIISASRRPGTYAVTLKSPCGAKTLPVTVR